MHETRFVAALAAGCFFLTPLASASVHYIAANGSDSNSGVSKTAAWLHAPGMPNCASNCASYQPVAGDQFIFRGGDTWHFGNSSASPYVGGTWGWNWSGSAGNSIYLGVDQTWYSGASWARPIFNADNPLSTTAVSSCLYQAGSGNTIVSLWFTNNVQFDNVELTGLCWHDVPSTTGNDMYIQFTAPVLITNVYIHGWTHTPFNCGNVTCGSATAFHGYAQNGGVTIDHSVVDGSDSDDGTLDVFYSDAYIIQYNVIRHVGGSSVPNNCHSVHDNLFEHINNSTDGAEHSDLLMCYGEASAAGSPNLFYNNVFRYVGTDHNVAPSAVLWLFPPSGQTDYAFNNVFHDINAGPNYIDLNQSGGPGGGNLALYNNTAIQGSSGCIVCDGTSNFLGTVTSENNHWISTGPSATFSSMANVTEKNALYMTPATAANQGYTSANDYAPTSAGNSTVGAGLNNASFCNSLSDPIAKPSCLSGTTLGCTYNAAKHSVSCPGLAAVSRPSTGSWDVGAYQFSGSVTTSGPSAPTALTAAAQ